MIAGCRRAYCILLSISVNKESDEVSLSQQYPENVREILAEYGDMLIKNPMTGEIAPLNEAIDLCVKDGVNHLVPVLAELTLESAGIVLNELSPDET